MFWWAYYVFSNIGNVLTLATNELAKILLITEVIRNLEKIELNENQ